MNARDPNWSNHQ